MVRNYPTWIENYPNDIVLRALDRDGEPITRENYIRYNWPGEKIDPNKPLPAELEAELPDELQLWEGEH